MSNATCEHCQHYEIEFDPGEVFEVDFSDGQVLDEYAGPYTVTPSQQEQVLNTSNMMVKQNIVVEAIPSNYGLITWNGSVLTVS